MKPKSSIKSFVEKTLLKPAYSVMLAGLLVRSVALVLTVAIPYSTWPLFVKVLIEAFAALGMVVCADIILSVAAASAAAKDRQIDNVRNSADYLPSPRLSKDKYDRLALILEKRRDTILSGFIRERQKEMMAVIFCATVTTLYGVLFAATILSKASWIAVLVEVVGVAGIPVFTWYLSAQYKETEDATPEETAKSLALASVDARLDAAKGRFKDGTETNEDLNLLERATDGNPYHKSLVKALRKPDVGVKYLTTPEVYSFFGTTDASKQATIRRIIRTAGQNNKYGIIQHPETLEWLTPKTALMDLFPRLINPNAPVTVRRVSSSKKRTIDTQAAPPDAPPLDQGSTIQRTPSGVQASEITPDSQSGTAQDGQETPLPTEVEPEATAPEPVLVQAHAAPRSKATPRAKRQPKEPTTIEDALYQMMTTEPEPDGLPTRPNVAPEQEA